MVRENGRFLTMASIEKNPQQQPNEAVSAKSFYKSWTAYDSLFEAAEATSYRSVWDLLYCNCCSTPECWIAQPVLELPAKYKARICWYDNVIIPSQHQCPLEPSVLKDLQRQFVGHHQKIELVLLYLKPSLDKIGALLQPYAKNLDDIPDSVTEQIIAKCQFSAHGWDAVADLVRGVTHMDRMQYLKYAPRLAGVSGGNSPLMMPLTVKTSGMESIFVSWTEERIAHEIQHHTNAGRIAEAFIDCLEALLRCWFDHIVTATTPIGLTRGTKGTPNTKLVERVLRLLHGSRLLKALGSLRQPITGIGLEMKQLHSYEVYPLADHYLDLFVDPGPEFASHSIGWLPKVYNVARQEYRELRQVQRSGIWEHFYGVTRPAFCASLRRLLGIDGDSTAVEIGLGSSVTEVVWRLLNAIQASCSCSGLSVLLPDDEFVTLQRAAGVLAKAGAKVSFCTWKDLPKRCVDSSEILRDEKKESGGIRKVLLFSLVNSCTQRIQSLDWVLTMSPDTLLVLDITQAVANIPLASRRIAELAVLPNVFLVGSLIKHARCGEGLGFMSYCASHDSILPYPTSGWTAYLSGLRENITVDGTAPSKLLYDPGLEWEGGTPSWAESAFVALRILSTLPSIEEQHSYVKHIQAAFLEQCHDHLSPEQRASVSDSNTLALPISKVPESKLPFGLDCKIVHGEAYLRIGFGIHNLDYHLGALVEFLTKSNFFYE